MVNEYHRTLNRRTYAFVVCLISIVAVLVSLPRAVSSIFDYQSPLHLKRSASELDVSSWENFRRELETRMGGREYNRWLWDQNETHNDNGWAAYESARIGRVNEVRFAARKNIIAYGSVVLVACVLFFTHLIIAWKSAVVEED